MITLCDINNCTQCFSCLSVCSKQCIEFHDKGEGFLEPSIDGNRCVECGLCEKSCHILHPLREKSLPKFTFAGWNNNISIRKKSSSGGVFSILANNILCNGGIVYGATMEKLKVKHIRVDNTTDLAKLRGSKYLQSNMRGIYEQVKIDLKGDLDRKVLFVGTPCQVSGLYSYLRKPYRNLITADIICHGVPSQSLFDRYLEKIKINPENTKEVIFRYLKGWGMQMSRITLSGKSLLISPRKAFYLRAFLRGMMFSKACYNCKYAETKRVGDLTLADFWEIGTVTSFEHDTRDGISMLLVNTTVGDDLVKKCKDITLVERSFKEALDGNPNLHTVSVQPAGCETYYDDLKCLSIDDFIKKYKLQPSWKDYLRPFKRYIEELLTGHSR